MPDVRVLGEGLLEVEYPGHLLDLTLYRFDDVVALNPGNDQIGDVVFPADVDAKHGTLVAVVDQPPRMDFNFLDKKLRRDAAAPELGTEVAIGTGTVRLRERSGGGRPQAARTAIGLDEPLEVAAVRSLHGLHVRLELRG